VDRSFVVNNILNSTFNGEGLLVLFGDISFWSKKSFVVFIYLQMLYSKQYSAANAVNRLSEWTSTWQLQIATGKCVVCTIANCCHN
jgi:low affinity Fe/Cu permease